MKISSRSTGAMQMPDSHLGPEPMPSKFQHALRTLFLKLDQMGSAIALGEAGDLEGAKALRDKHSPQRA